MQINLDLNNVLVVAGLVVAVLSAVSSVLNHVVRQKQIAKEPIPLWLSTLGVLVNVLAVNLDKAVVLGRAVKTGTVESGTVAALPAESAPALCSKCGAALPPAA